MKQPMKQPIKQATLATLMLIAVLLLAACGGSAVTPDTPPTIHYGEDVCDHCGMIINDERFAAGVVIQTQPQQYEHRIFDDIGDMFAFAHEAQETAQVQEIVTYYVHDYASREWIDAHQATFVQGAAASTPMGSGLAAFADPTDAAAHAQATQGDVFDFAALLAQPPQPHAMHP